MTSKSKDIIFLLGAGASVEAEIPASGMMIDRIENLLVKSPEWKSYLDLYHHIKSAIYYAQGLKGLFNENVQYNIETLVNTLYELERNEDHPLYPFIASWNSRLITLAHGDFSVVRQFRLLILRQLKKWMSPDDISLAEYYRGLITLQKGLNFPLRIFSLNYDMCVERLNSADFRVETGFAAIGSKFIWDWERFEDSESGPPPPQVYLYKLHGSINWKRDDAKNLYSLEQTEGIPPEEMEVIFGRDFKLEAADPYLFYTYEFRKFSLLARLIVSIGYGFGDSHINKILSQALAGDANRRLLVISRCNDDPEKQRKHKDAIGKLGAKPDQIVFNPKAAKKFLETTDLDRELLKLIPAPMDSAF
ncbi:MAG TPA: SIR2 family protein [Nitrospiraceae bacterium]|jgi:hypothetical protein